MSTFTCITCSVAFRTAGLQRDHYKADWHRYNLKRKVAELGPVTLSDFQSRVARLAKQTIEDDDKNRSGYCGACRKSFANERAYENHLRSKKHVEMASAFDKNPEAEELVRERGSRKEVLDAGRKEEAEMEVEEADSDEWEGSDAPPIPVTTCLFCPTVSKSLERCAVHMTAAHSFFFPDPEYVADLEGLMEYLGAKVGQGRVCLWCDARSKEFRTLDAVQKHMVDKGHCKILHEGDSLAEFADFYDYSKSHPDGDGNDDDDDDDAVVDLNRLDDSGYELVLPSGARIGHRSLMRYYRQSLPPERALAVRRGAGKLLGHYKTLGWTGITGAEAKKKERDLKFMRKVQQKSWMRLGMRANKLQKHWRDPTMLY